MKHLSYEEFRKLMEKRRETTIVTNDGIYQFTGLTKNTVCVQFSLCLRKEYQISEKEFLIEFDKVVTLTEAGCMYMSLE